jgi:hypothetical protein
MAAGDQRRVTPVPVPAEQRMCSVQQQKDYDEELITVVYIKLAAMGHRSLGDKLLAFVTRQQQALSSMQSDSRFHVLDMQAAYLQGKSELLRKTHALVESITALHSDIQTMQITAPMWQ